MKLSEIGEDALLERLVRDLPRNEQVIAGAGDDCAVVTPAGAGKLLLLKTDAVVEGVHFTSAAKPADVGWKAMARPLSDFAAMSGVPQFALVSLIAPADTRVQWVAAFYRGAAKVAAAFDVAIVGGETSRTTGPVAISVNIAGWVERKRWLARSGGKPGDQLYVTGRLGGSLGGRHLRFTPRIRESRWLTENFKVHAMMDLSDGLGADLPRLARASDVGFEVDEEALPRHRGCSIEAAISDGEDYELLFAIAPAEAKDLPGRWRTKFPQLPLTRIGSLNRRSKIEKRKFPAGYVHFQ
jgi:thiamine-monophosphate kinase